MIIKGKVLHGKKRGRKLGYPTININFTKHNLSGIYVARVRYLKKNYNAVTFIGNAKTFGEKEIFAETYILGFKKNVYGKWVKIVLLKKIRENQKFESEKELIDAIKNDINFTQEYFKNV